MESQYILRLQAQGCDVNIPATDSCPGCSQDFSYQKPIFLLKCRHLICKECFAYQDFKDPKTGRNICLVCHVPAEIWKENIEKIFVPLAPPQNQIDITIRTELQRHKLLRNISIDMTVGQILQKHEILQVLNLKVLKQQDLTICFNGRDYLYKLAKNKKISQLNNIRFGKRTNDLFWHYRFCGC